MKLFVIVFVVFLVGLVSSGPLKDIPALVDLRSQAFVRYRINPAKSSFIAHANRTGLAWFRGHSHRIAVRDFSGEASLTPDVINPASLQMTARAASLEETDPVFTQQQKDIINKELKEIVLHPDKYPEISFQSTSVKGGLKNGKVEVVITGNLTLHGVTKPIEIRRPYPSKEMTCGPPANLTSTATISASKQPARFTVWCESRTI
jgi:polyisoprenoid-binding protein YceI